MSVMMALNAKCRLPHAFTPGQAVVAGEERRYIPLELLSLDILSELSDLQA
jgi:hypothetical protein